MKCLLLHRQVSSQGIIRGGLCLRGMYHKAISTDDAVQPQGQHYEVLEGE